MGGIQVIWYYPSSYPHVFVQGFEFTNKKGMWLDLLQMLKHVFPVDWWKNLRCVNFSRTGYNM